MLPNKHSNFWTFVYALKSILLPLQLSSAISPRLFIIKHRNFGCPLFSYCRKERSNKIKFEECAKTAGFCSAGQMHWWASTKVDSVAGPRFITGKVSQALVLGFLKEWMGKGFIN